MMQYTVIWRADDDFAFTEVSTARSPEDVTALEWVVMAAEVEYAGWDEEDRIAATASLLDSFELLGVLEGTPRFVA